MSYFNVIQKFWESEYEGIFPDEEEIFIIENKLTLSQLMVHFKNIESKHANKLHNIHVITNENGLSIALIFDEINGSDGISKPYYEIELIEKEFDRLI